MIVGISGKLRSGKDTVAEILLDAFGETACKRMALADVLKEECSEIYGLDLERVYNDYDYKEEIRHILIKHGADRRAEDIDYWVKKVLETMTNPVTLVPDVRYRNEVDTLATGADKALLIRINTTDEARVRHGWNRSKADTDPSECQLDGYTEWDLVVNNNGTIDDLKHSLAPVVNLISDYLEKNSL